MNKIVLITGATAGIGQETARQFAAIGAKLIITGRRQERLAELAAELKSSYQTDVHILQFDVSDKVAVKEAFSRLPSEWQAIDILVNNAGLVLGLDPIPEGDEMDWDIMIDTNIKGLLYVTRCVLPGMLARNQGHVVNIGSISAHHVYPGGSVYCATKYAVRALTTGTKMDVHGSNIRVTEIDPGMVETEFSNVRFKGDDARADGVYEGVNNLVAADIADAIIYCVTRPPHVDIREIKIYPTDQTAPHMVRRDVE